MVTTLVVPAKHNKSSVISLSFNISCHSFQTRQVYCDHSCLIFLVIPAKHDNLMWSPFCTIFLVIPAKHDKSTVIILVIPAKHDKSKVTTLGVPAKHNKSTVILLSLNISCHTFQTWQVYRDPTNMTTSPSLRWSLLLFLPNTTSLLWSRYHLIFLVVPAKHDNLMWSLFC
jgi:hypothetical protein